VQLPRVVPELQQVLAQKPQRELVLEQQLARVLEQQLARVLELEQGPVLRLAQELPLVRLVHCDRCSRVHLLE
jgi:hypothetical protein